VNERRLLERSLRRRLLTRSLRHLGRTTIADLWVGPGELLAILRF
jgi:hypothetical protein